MKKAAQKVEDLKQRAHSIIDDASLNEHERAMLESFAGHIVYVCEKFEKMISKREKELEVKPETELA